MPINTPGLSKKLRKYVIPVKTKSISAKI